MNTMNTMIFNLTKISKDNENNKNINNNNIINIQNNLENIPYLKSKKSPFKKLKINTENEIIDKENENNLIEEYKLEFNPKYNLDNIKIIEEKIYLIIKYLKYMKIEQKKLIFKKTNFDDGYIIIYFNNGDINQIFPDKKI